MKTGIHPREKALLHIYPVMAELSDMERREILSRVAGVVSASDPAFSQDGFEQAMAAYETILWDRVRRGLILDPRNCRVCGCAMKPVTGASTAECPEGCERRKVYAWAPDYWRKKLPVGSMANSRVLWKLRELWDLLIEYLPAEQQNARYLAGIMGAAVNGYSASFFLDPARGGGDEIAWHRVDAQVAHCTIEAIKDRLKYSIKDGPDNEPF